MKAISLFAASSTFLVTAANMNFPYVQPACDHVEDPQRCLHGQMCLETNTCVAISNIYIRHQGASSPPGRCGVDFGGAVCKPNEEFGGCCSGHGWCGTTLQHCLRFNGCQSGCVDDVASEPGDGSILRPEAATAPPSMQPGDVHSEPVIGRPITAAPGPAATGGLTYDGSCGANKGDTTCGDWPLGSCCSMYGFCGKSNAHCGEGCQSGPCYQAQVSPAPLRSPAPPNPNPGSFKVVGQSGVPAMHAALLPNGNVAFLDKIETYTELTLRNGRYAYSCEYDPTTNLVKSLSYQTNAFCAGGSFMTNGTLLSVGGNAPLTWFDPTVGDGIRGIRYLSRSAPDASFDDQDWIEPGNQLDTARWYPTVQTLANGSLFVASGSLNGLDPTVNSNNNPTYEILDVYGNTLGESIVMPLLERTQPHYMYPFIHLLHDGTLFVFVSTSSEIFDISRNQAVRTFQDLPGDYRTYPNTGGSVLLPLSFRDDWIPEIVICGGGAYQDITSPTDASCGRIRPFDDNVMWEMDSMPEGRVMVEGTLLPDGTVVWVNGASQGAQGFRLAEIPTMEALVYDPEAPLGQRWTRGASSPIPRLYHSVALLLLDGTLLIAGSNPVEMPILQADEENPYITEFQVEVYTPPYLSGDNGDRRPMDVILSSTQLTADSSTFDISFTAPPNAENVKVALYHGGFVTHSLHMSHRMLFLENEGWQVGAIQQELTVAMPPDNNVAPPGPYVVYVTVDGVPSVGQFVMVASGR